MWVIDFYSRISNQWQVSDYNVDGGFYTPADARASLSGRVSDSYLTFGAGRYRYRNTATGEIISAENFQPYNKEIEPMPNLPVTVTPVTPTTTPNPAMVKVDIKRGLEGRLTLSVDATNLHQFLDNIGVPHDGTEYQNGPPSSSGVFSGALLSPRLFLKKSPVNIDLGPLFSSPPTIARLRELAASAQPVVRSIVDHYQPIDISVTVHKRAK